MPGSAEFSDFFYPSSDGLRLHARVYGDAGADRWPVVCLPGLSRNARDFHGLALYLAHRAARPRRVVAFDYRGRGQSQHDADIANYTVVKEALGLRYAFKGPFEIADLGGLDIWSKVTGHLFPELGVSRSAPESLLAKAAEGQLGAKSGAGFYRYDDADEVKDNFEQQLQDLVGLKRESSSL